MIDKQYNLEKIVENCDKLKHYNYKQLLEHLIDTITIVDEYEQSDVDIIYMVRDLIINMMEYLDK